MTRMPDDAVQLACDFGLSNLKIAWADADGVLITSDSRPNTLRRMDGEALRVLVKSEQRTGAGRLQRIVVTGGQSHQLPDSVDGVPVVKVPELLAIARGGLLLAEQARVAPRPREAIVVSCGTGTAMIAARLAGATHSGGTGVGGGTLQGLGSLMLGTRSVHDIDRLAQAGETTRVDSTLLEVLGSGFGQLPADATAVNFGKLARESALDPTREDIAAALVTMIAQTIALIAIQCARREALDTVIMVGHLAGLPSVSAQLFRTASFYGANFVVPAQGGYATLLGALAAAQIGDDVVPAL